MKKVLLLFIVVCSISIIVGCSKNAPMQTQQLTSQKAAPTLTQAKLPTSSNVTPKLTQTKQSTFSDVQTEFANDVKIGSNRVEKIYCWEDFIHDDSKGANEQKQTTVIYDPSDQLFDDSQKASFIKTYLQGQGQYKEVPDGVTLDNEGRPLVEYYFNQDKSKLSFVVHMWGNYLTDFDAGTRVKTDAIYCTTLHLDDLNKVGNLISKYEPEKNVTEEKLYDAQGKHMASISYQYIKGVPFPFITNSWNLNTCPELIRDGLCRNQKIWFYKEQSQFDDSGKWIGYNGYKNEYDTKEYFKYPSSSSYNSSELKKITEERQDCDSNEFTKDSSGEMKLNYHDGMLNSIDYWRSSSVHGTWDSSGKIYYDKKGRMIDNDYYVTSGGQDKIFLYQGESRMPWACIYWDSFINNFEKIYLFIPA